MKKLTLFLLFTFSICTVFSQRKLAGFDVNGGPGKIYLDTPRNIYVSHPIVPLNDSTMGMDTGRYYISTILKNVTRDSIIFTFADGTRVAVKDSAGGGSGSGTWNTTGNSLTDTTTDFFGTSDDKSIMIRTNNTLRGMIKNEGLFFNGTARYGSRNYTIPIKIQNSSSMSGTAVAFSLKNINTTGQEYMFSSNPDGTLSIGWWGEAYNQMFDGITLGSFGSVSLNATNAFNLRSNNYLSAFGPSQTIEQRGLTFSLENSGANTLINSSGTFSFQGPIPLSIRALSISIGDGTAANSSAALDIPSTTRGVLLPRMTKTQRDAISSPATGLILYQTDNTPGLRVYNGTNWMRFTETAD